MELTPVYPEVYTYPQHSSTMELEHEAYVLQSKLGESVCGFAGLTEDGSYPIITLDLEKAMFHSDPQAAINFIGEMARKSQSVGWADRWLLRKVRVTTVHKFSSTSETSVKLID